MEPLWPSSLLHGVANHSALPRMVLVLALKVLCLSKPLSLGNEDSDCERPL